MARPHRSKTPEEVAGALLAAKGLVSFAADKLKLSQTTVRDYINTFPVCQQALKDAREKMGDAAESALFEALENKNLGAVNFYLKTVGKDRGYVERTEVAGVSDAPITVNIARVTRRTDPNEQRTVETNDSNV